MRKTMLTIIWPLLFLSTFASSIQSKILIPAPPSLAANAWILMDANTGKVLIENNADEQLPPASLTKIMTSYIVAKDLENGRINEDDEVPISVTAWKMGGSRMFIQEGTKVLLSDLLKGVIVSSGNDASVALAEYIAGSENAFADIMNQQASLLGMSGTHYSNATGWPDDGHLTTARDLALLSRALINDYPTQYSIYAEKYFKFNNIDQTNRNSLLWRDRSVDGLKTGHTEEAGYCLVASATRKGMRLISVVMGAKSKAARAQESQKLLSYGFRYYETNKMYSAGDVVEKDAPVWYGTENKVNLVVSENVYLTIPQGSKKDLKSKIVLNDIIEAPLTETEELGKMSVYLDEDTLAKFPIFAEHAVDEAGIFERLWDSLEIMFMGFFE
jgi:D-alanyl-D-alanine carboxypeptidase (penicillin-binding protein 5/6)